MSLFQRIARYHLHTFGWMATVGIAALALTVAVQNGHNDLARQCESDARVNQQLLAAMSELTLVVPEPELGEVDPSLYKYIVLSNEQRAKARTAISSTFPLESCGSVTSVSTSSP